jgi:hypothetical protein
MCTVLGTVRLYALLMRYQQETQTRSRCRVKGRREGKGREGCRVEYESVTWKLLHDKGNYCNSNRVEAYLSVWSVMMQERVIWWRGEGGARISPEMA